MRRRLATIAAAILLGACSSAPKRSTSGSVPSCPGDRTVIVSNRSNREADVIAERRNGAAPVELGTVTPGRQEEFTLPADVSYARTRFPREGGAQLRGTVDLRYGCR